MSKPLSKQLWDWQSMDSHIQPDEWKLQEWSRMAEALESPWISVYVLIEEGAYVNDPPPIFTSIK